MHSNIHKQTRDLNECDVNNIRLLHFSQISSKKQGFKTQIKKISYNFRNFGCNKFSEEDIEQRTHRTGEGIYDTENIWIHSTWFYEHIVFHVINNQQHGLLEGRFITSNYWYTDYLVDLLDRTDVIHSSYTNFSKAFVKVGHSILLHKFLSYGI